MKPKFNLHFIIDDPELVDFLETSFETKTKGIIQSIQRNYETYKNIENPHQIDLINAPIALKKKIIQNLSYKEYEHLGFMLAELSGVFNSNQTIDIQHKKRELEA